MLPDQPYPLPLPKSALLERMAAAGLRPRKGLGQHFLIDDNLLRAIVADADLGPEEGAFEVGPGPGLLTRHLAARARHVWAVEVDERILAVARDLLGPTPQVSWLACDVLERKGALNADVVDALAQGAADYGLRGVPLVANLPYNVSVPLIANLLQAERFGAVGRDGGARRLAVPRLVCLVQREVAERLAARAGEEPYGAVSVLTQVLARVEILRLVPPAVFWPRPAVQSAVVRLTVRPRAETAAFGDGEPFARLRALVRAAFGTRRKGLLRSLTIAQWPAETVAAVGRRAAGLGLDPRVRGEALAPGVFLQLAGIDPPPASI